MSYAYQKTSYIPKSEVKSGSTKSNLLKDNSWIKKDVEEDEPVDRDPNFGRAVLSRLKSNEYPDGSTTATEPSSTITTSTSVQSISKRFSGTQAEPVKSSPPPSYDKAISSKSTKVVSSDGKTTETTITTTRTSGTKRPTETFTERVFSDVKSSSKPKPGIIPPKPKITSDTEATTRKGTWSVSSPKTSETTTVTTFTETIKNDDYSRTYSSPPSYTTSTTRTRSVTSPTAPDTTTAYTDSLKDKSLDVLSDDLSSLPSSSDYKTSSPASSTTTRTRSVTSPQTFDTSTLKTFTDPTKDKPLDDLADDLISLPTSSEYPSRGTDYSRSYSSSSPNSSTTTRTWSSSSPKTSESTTVTTFTETIENDDYSKAYSSSPSYTTSTTRTRSVSSPKPSETMTVTTYTDRLKDKEYNRTYSSPDSTSSTRTVRSYSSSDYSSPVRTNSYSVSSDQSYSDDLYKSRSYSTLPRDSSYEYSSVSSPSSYTKTSYLENSPSGSYSDIQAKSSGSLYSSTDRTITARDICTYCRKPMSTEAKMILDDLQIHCHASCFKCEVCSSSLGHLKAGDTMWIYQRTVHCERCFETTREKWRR